MEEPLVVVMVQDFHKAPKQWWAYIG